MEATIRSLENKAEEERKRGRLYDRIDASKPRWSDLFDSDDEHDPEAASGNQGDWRD